MCSSDLCNKDASESLQKLVSPPATATGPTPFKSYSQSVCDFAIPIYRNPPGPDRDSWGKTGGSIIAHINPVDRDGHEIRILESTSNGIYVEMRIPERANNLKGYAPPDSCVH